MQHITKTMDSETSLILGIKSALNAFTNGNFVIVMDDSTRENEGDLIIRADAITEEQTTFMLNNTTGILCVSLPSLRLETLGLSLMVSDNTDKHATAFTITTDFKHTTTGVSSHDRSLTINALVNDEYSAEDFNKPGHVFPLVYTEGGLRARRGHTEAAGDLCKLIGCKLGAALSELRNPTGTMMTQNDCRSFSKLHRIPFITITEMVTYMDNTKFSPRHTLSPKGSFVLDVRLPLLINDTYHYFDLMLYKPILKKYSSSCLHIQYPNN